MGESNGNGGLRRYRPIRGRSRLCLLFLPSQLFMLQHRNADKKGKGGENESYSRRDGNREREK